MRAWLYDTLVQHEPLQMKMSLTEPLMREHVMPRFTRHTINLSSPFLVYGMGSNSNENLAEDPDHIAHRQFFQIWIHDRGADFGVIDDIVEILKDLLIGASDAASKVTTVRWLETSAEFNNESYGTIFRYVRFQAIISKGSVAA